MGILNWFKQKPKEDFEALLQSLSLQIQERQQRLSEIKLRERRATLAFTLYALALWLAYAVLWWFDGLAPLVRLGALLASGWSSGSSSSSSSAADGEAFHDDDGEGENELLRRGGNVLLALPAFVGPVGIYYIRRVVKLWYTRQEGFEEKHLRELRAKQRTTIEDIKTKSNYYSTKNLLEKYDETPKAATGPQANLRRRAFQPPSDPRAPPASPGSPSPNSATPHRPSTPGAPLAVSPFPLAGGGPDAMGGGAAASPAPFPVIPPTPPRKQWFDRLADAVLGEEPGAGAGAGDMSKYALVCEKCFAWNGLVDAKRWGDTQYKCPKCGHFNPAPNARSAIKKYSPTTTPATPSPLSHEAGNGGGSSGSAAAAAAGLARKASGGSSD